MHFVLKTHPSPTNFFIRIFFFQSRHWPLTPISAIQLPTKDAMMTEGRGLVYNSADWSPATYSGCYYLSITVMCGRYQGPFSTCLLLCSQAGCCQRSRTWLAPLERSNFMPDILEELHYRLLFPSLLAVIIFCDSIALAASLGLLRFWAKN